MTVIDEHIIETIRDMQKELTTYELTPQISELRQANAELADELDRLRRDHVDLKLRHSRLSADNDDALQFNKLQSGELESARQRISELESLKGKAGNSSLSDEDASLREALAMAEGYLRQIATIVFDGEVLDDWQHLTNRVRMLKLTNDQLCKRINNDDSNAIERLKNLVEMTAGQTVDREQRILEQAEEKRQLNRRIDSLKLERDELEGRLYDAMVLLGKEGEKAENAEEKLEQSREASREAFRAIAEIVMPDGEMPFDWQILIRTMRQLRADYNMLLDSRSIALGPTREQFEREIAALNEKLSNQVDDIIKLRHINGQQSVEIQRLRHARHELEQSALRLSDNLSVIEGQRAVIRTMKANCDQLQARLLKAESPTILPESPMLSVDPEPLSLPPVTERCLSGSESWREFQMQDAGGEEVQPSLEELANHPDHRVSIPAQILLDPPSTFNPSSAEILEDLKHRMGEGDEE